MASYIKYQADNGAQAVQIFDSWATELSPVDFEEFSLPYLKQIVDSVKETHPDLPLILYASGSGGHEYNKFIVRVFDQIIDGDHTGHGELDVVGRHIDRLG